PSGFGGAAAPGGGGWCSGGSGALAAGVLMLGGLSLVGGGVGGAATRPGGARRHRGWGGGGTGGGGHGGGAAARLLGVGCGGSEKGGAGAGAGAALARVGRLVLGLHDVRVDGLLVLAPGQPALLRLVREQLAVAVVSEHVHGLGVVVALVLLVGHPPLGHGDHLAAILEPADTVRPGGPNRRGRGLWGPGRRLVVGPPVAGPARQ